MSRAGPPAGLSDNSTRLGDEQDEAIEGASIETVGQSTTDEGSQQESKSGGSKCS